MHLHFLQVLQQVMLEFEARNCEDNCETTPPVKEHELDTPINQDMPTSQLESLTEEPTCSQEETEESTRGKQVEKKCQVSLMPTQRTRRIQVKHAYGTKCANCIHSCSVFKPK